MGGLGVRIPLGAEALYHMYNGQKGFKCLPRVESKESQDKLESFHYLVKETCIRSATRFILENKMEAEDLSLREQLQLQAYDFDFYLQSCKFIEFDSCPKQLVKDKMLDQKRFDAFDQEKCVDLFDIFPTLPEEGWIFGKEKMDVYDQGKFVEALERHINELKELESIDELYVYRKSLANCEFIKPESDFDAIFYRLKHEENWTVADDVLKTALQQNLSLLHALKSNPKANGIIPHKPTELLTSDIQEAVDREHRAELRKCVQKHLERRLECYHLRVEFKQFFNQGVIDFDASGVEYVPESVTPQSKRRTPVTLPAKLSELLYQSKKLPKRIYAVKLLSRLGDSGIIRKRLLLPQQLNHVFSKSTKGWPALMAVGAGLVKTGFGMSSRKEKAVVQ